MNIIRSLSQNDYSSRSLFFFDAVGGRPSFFFWAGGHFRGSSGQFGAVRGSSGQFGTVRNGSTQLGAARHSSTQLDAARHSSTQLGAARRSSVQLKAAQRSSTQLDAARRSSTQLNAALCFALHDNNKDKTFSHFPFPVKRGLKTSMISSNWSRSTELVQVLTGPDLKS